MSTEKELADFHEAMERADKGGDFLVAINLEAAVALISAVQLATRHPAARSSTTLKGAAKVARLLQGFIATREPVVDQYLERGWHEVFDVKSEGG